MRGEKLALSVVGLAGAAAKASGWGVVATACELALKSADVGRAISDIPVDPVRAAVARVNAAIVARLGETRPAGGNPGGVDETDAILDALDRALPGCVPSVRTLVQADLDFSVIQRGLQAELARAEPAFFALDRRGTQVLAQLLSTAFDALARDTAFADAMRVPLAAETLQRLTLLQASVDGLPEAVAEQLVAVLEQQGFVRKAEGAGLERRVIIALARRLKPQEALDFNQALIELEHAVDIACEQIARGQRASNEDAFIRDVLARVTEATRRGEFDQGARAVDDALAALARREAEQQDRNRRDRVTLLETGITQDTLRRDAPSVAQRIEALVAAEGAGDRPAWSAAFRRRWDQWYEDGLQKGVNFSLAVAESLARWMSETAQNADERGRAALLLGNALVALGERESSTARLKQAVEAFRAAQMERTRDRAPLDWATTQNNLGAALAALGERESGTARLELAIEAYRAALQERTRERVPLDWATTQNNLGNALRALGERESGTARLEQAVEAYGAALLERPRERAPQAWATTQNNLGTALGTLASRESGTAILKRAATAFRAALLEYTREHVPLKWATTQNNLGNVLAALGERESGTARLEQAVEVYRFALLERTRERVPLDWAATQNNLGNALQAFGQRESGTARLEQAVEAYRAALLEHTRERLPLRWAFSQHALANALAALATRLHDAERMAEALDCMRNAAVVYRECGNSYWLPIAEQRIKEIEAALAAMDPT